MRKILKRGAGILGLLFVLLVAVIAYNTIRYTPPETVKAEPFELGVSAADTARILSRAVQFQTISTDLTRPAFGEFLTFLKQSFPAAHNAMERVVLDPNTPLFKWTGSDESLAPILLAAHYDVVPVAPGSLKQWKYPPFDGELADGYVWGRGTLDNKGALIALVSAAEHLISKGFTPKRTIYLSFDGDEEIGGSGAESVTKYLVDKGVKLAWVLDEGSFVLDDIIPGLDVPVASINLSEKGYTTLTLVAKSPGGHSSMPPRMTAVGRVSRAVNRLQNSPVPGGITGISAEFFDGLGRHFTLEKRILFANRWLFGPILNKILSGSPATNAMLRSTTAPTMLSGSNKENVLAAQATATINFRLHPRDTIAGIVAHVKKTIDDDKIEIRFDQNFSTEASPVASNKSTGYKDIEASIQASFGLLASVSGLTIAATDARHYALAAENAYRINPFMITNDDLVRFHGINERLSLENLQRGLNFYGALISKQ